MKDSQHSLTNDTTAETLRAESKEQPAERAVREHHDHASLDYLRERLRATVRDDAAYQEALRIMQEYAEQFKAVHSAVPNAPQRPQRPQRPQHPQHAEPSSLEDAYRQVLDALEDHVLLKAADSTIVWANKAYCAFYNTNLDALKGMADAGLTNADRAAQHLRDDRFVITSRQLLEIPAERCTRYDGAVRWFHTIKSPIVDRSGSVTHTVSIAQDITQRRQVEEALQRSVEWYQTMFDRAPFGIAVINVDGILISCNHAFCQMMDGALEDFLATHISELVHPDDRLFVEELFRAAMLPSVSDEDFKGHQSKKFSITKRLQDLHGKTVWVNLTSCVIYDADGLPQYAFTTLENVSEHTRAKQALALSEERYKLMFEQSPVGIGICSTDGYVLSVNQAFCRMLGYVEEELVGRRCTEFTHPDDVELEVALLNEMLRTNPDIASSRIAYRKRYITKDRGTTWANLSCCLMYDESHHLSYVLSHVEDITDRKQTEDALLESERLLRSIFLAMPDVVLLLDHEGRYLSVGNRQALGLYHPADELLGRTVQDILPVAEAQYVMAAIEQALLEEKVIQIEYSLDIAGRQTWFDAKIVPVSSNTVLCVARDVTQRKQFEQELFASNQRLKALDHEKNALLEIVAHDLKSPLSAILGMMEVLRMAKDSANDDVVSYAEAVEQTAGRALKLVQTLLSLNAIENGARLLAIEPINVSSILHDVVQAHQQQAQSKNIRLHFIPPKFPIWAEADELATRQIIENLLSNAIKYSPFNRSVWLNVSEHHHRESHGERSSPTVRIVVKDEGPGLSEQDQAKLFQKFSRLSPQPTAGEHSTGLGLSIAKGLAELMHGTVSCVSAPQAGATFVLELPAELTMSKPESAPRKDIKTTKL